VNQQPSTVGGSPGLPPSKDGQGVSDYDQLVGDYTNPILQPWAAEVVKKFGEISLAGIIYPNPSNQCWPEPVPFIFKRVQMQIIQQADKITILYGEDHEVRWVRGLLLGELLEFADHAANHALLDGGFPGSSRGRR
jgi:hypothetical protein